MKTVRRLYFYAVAFISIEIVLWGLIDLLRSIVDNTVGGQAEVLARALALILVGMPIFLFHWLWAQRNAARDPEEQAAGLRALFLYAILISTLIPLVQNILALIDRVFLDSAQLELSRAIFGHAQPWQDSLIAILMNGLVAAYFWSVVRSAWPRLPVRKAFSDVRRLYRYAWLLYSLIMTIFGAQQVLRFLFFVRSDVLGDIGREVAGQRHRAAGRRHTDLGLRVAGHPGFACRPGGTGFQPAAGSVVPAGVERRHHGAHNSRHGRQHHRRAASRRGPLHGGLHPRTGRADSIGVPLGAIWAYYGYWLNRHIESIGDPVRQASMKRAYLYVLSALGLGGAFIGVATLIKFIIDYLTGGLLVLSEGLRFSLASAISLIVAWLPLWLMTWRPLQAQAFARDDAGDHRGARSSGGCTCTWHCSRAWLAVWPRLWRCSTSCSRLRWAAPPTVRSWRQS